MKYSIALVALVSFVSTALYGSPSYKEKEMNDVRRTFTFRGHPIHPEIVHRFAGWKSEGGYPTTVTIDLNTAAGSGEFPNEGVTKEGNKVSTQAGNETFAYEWLGVVKSGTHVVLAQWSEAGPAAEGSEAAPAKTKKKVLFLRTAKGKAFLESGKLYDRLLLTEERRYPIADNEEVSAKLANDKVTLTMTAAGGKKRSATLDIQ